MNSQCLASCEPHHERSAILQLALSTLAFTVCFYAWTLYGPLAPILHKALNLSEVEVSWLIAIPVVLGSLMRIPLGFLSQRFGGRAIFVALMLFVILPLLAIALWHSSFIALLTFGFLLGFAGASFAVGVPFVNDWYPPAKRGLVLGIYGMGTGGTVIAGLIAPLLAGAYGVWAPFAFAALLIVIVALAFILWGRNAPDFTPSTAKITDTFSVFGKSFRAWILTLAYFVTFGGFVAMFLYLPQILAGVYALSHTDAGARAAGFAFLSVVARPIGGYLADRYGGDRVLVFSLGFAAAVAAFMSSTYMWMVPFTLSCLTIAAIFGAGSGAIFKVVGTDFPKSVGAVTGVVGAAGGLGGFFPPIIMGIVKAYTGSYSIGFALLALVCAICLAVLLFAKREESP